jgi:hypothetical protein
MTGGVVRYIASSGHLQQSRNARPPSNTAIGHTLRRDPDDEAELFKPLSTFKFKELRNTPEQELADRSLVGGMVGVHHWPNIGSTAISAPVTAAEGKSQMN